MSTPSPLIEALENGRPVTPFRTLYGDLVDPTQPVWPVQAAVDGGGLLYIRVGLFEDAARGARWSNEAINTAVTYLADRLRRKAPTTVENERSALQRLAHWTHTQPELRTFDWAYYDAAVAGRFLLYRMKSKERGNDFTRIRVFYRWAKRLSLPGFSPAVLSALEAIRAPGNRKGEAVRHRTADGPLTRDERALLVRALLDGAGNHQDRATVMLLLERGSYPRQISRIQNADLARYDTPGGVFNHLGIPRNKKRTAKRETKKGAISDRLGRLLEQLQRGGPGDRLLWWIRETDPIQSVSASLKRWIRAAEAVEPGMRETLRLIPRRLRYSLATDAHEKGASPQVLAEILDHSDLQNVRIYAQTSPGRVVDDASRATDPVLKPLVRRFLGQITDSLDEPIHEGQPAEVIPGKISHIPGLVLDLGGIGLCGLDHRKERPCQKLPPFSCYGCSRFHAHRDGPHLQVRDSFQAYIDLNPAGVDQVILTQLGDVVTTVDELVAKLTAPGGAE